MTWPCEPSSMETLEVALGERSYPIYIGEGLLENDILLKKITFDDTLLKESKEIIEDLIVAAHNDAKLKLKKKTSEEISKVTGGVSLPPGFKLPF